jgi:hypothetical protein
MLVHFPTRNTLTLGTEVPNVCNLQRLFSWDTKSHGLWPGQQPISSTTEHQFSRSQVLSPAWHHELKLPCRTSRCLFLHSTGYAFVVSGGGGQVVWTSGDQCCASGGGVVICCTLRFSALSFRVQLCVPIYIHRHFKSQASNCVSSFIDESKKTKTSRVMGSNGKWDIVISLKFLLFRESIV